MLLLADGIDLTSPTAILFGGIIAVGTGIVVLWKVSRTDITARLAAKEAECEAGRERERVHVAERSQWVEIQLRSAKAQEALANGHRELEEQHREIMERLVALEALRGGAR